jgi:trehalose 6-phosphate phosphatase
MQGGKMIWELKPSGRDKGKSIAEFNDEPPFAGRTPVFIGDDVTDETAFKAVNELEGITIKVGPGATSSRYRLVNDEAVRSWLEAWIQYAASLRKPSAS